MNHQTFTEILTPENFVEGGECVFLPHDALNTDMQVIKRLDDAIVFSSIENGKRENGCTGAEFYVEPTLIKEIRRVL